MMLFVKIILAHILGDFFLQSRRSIEQKRRLKWLSPHLFLHTVIHFVLVLLIAGWQLWPQALIIAVAHYVIDGCKLQFETAANRQTLFFVDQLAHIAVIIAVVWYTAGIPGYHFESQHLVLITFILLLTRPTSFFISHAMSHWNDRITADEEAQKSLPNAGQFIGIIERLLIFAFIVIGQWGAIGFLMAAKSIFRFGDLTRARDRRLTEYILIGTFLSFGIAIGAGIMYTRFF